MLCPNCGADLGDRQIKFCPNCGKGIPAVVLQPKSDDVEPVSLWEDLQFDKKISKSRDSVLYRAFCKNTNSYSAVKVITIPAQWEDCEKLLSAGMSAENLKKHFAEIANYRFMLCRRLQALKGCKNIVDIDDVQIIKKDQLRWELQVRTELLTPFSSVNFGADIREGAIAKLAADLCDGAAALHRTQVIIGGISLDDIYMDRQGNYKLGVFADAQSRILSEESFCGPEVLAGGIADARSDIYSIGMIMHYLLNNKQRIGTNLMFPPKNASTQMAGVIACACAQDPNGRYSSVAQFRAAILDAIRPPKPAGNGKETTDKPGSVKPPKKAEKKNNKGLLIGILAGVIALLLAVGAFFGIRWLRNADVEMPAFADDVKDSPNDDTWKDEDEPKTDKHTDPIQDEHAEDVEATEAETQAVVVMPNVVGMEYTAAVAILSENSCTVTFEYEFSNTIEKNFVISQSVPADSILEEGTNVILVVSQGPDAAPEGYDQKVVVNAGSGSSYGTLVFYEWEEGQWISKFSCDATVGKNGISSNYGEGKGRSPEGTYKLGVALSANSIPNSGWPFQQVSSNTCVVDDVDSIYYNTIQNKNNLPSGTSYDPIGNTIVKGYSTICIYIEHNGNGIDSNGVVAGKGSVITLCGRSGSLKPTAGCVDISSSNMTTLLGMLDYSKNPHIEIYVQ